MERNVIDPEEERVQRFIAEHPHGGTQAQVGAVLGVSHQAVMMIERRAMKKMMVLLRWHRIRRTGDAI